MQTLTFYVTADSTLGAVRDYANAKNASAPTLTRGVSACLKMRVFANAENADPYPLAELASIPSWQFVMDDDFDSSSNYILVADHDEIAVQSVTETINEVDFTFSEFSIPIRSMNTAELNTLLGTQESVATLNGELVGFDENGNEVFVLQIKGFTVRNRISSTGNPTEIGSEYLTEAQVRALCAAGLDLIFSESQSELSQNWHQVQTEQDRFFRMRLNGDSRIWENGPAADAGWSDCYGLVTGAKGDPGQDAETWYTHVAFAVSGDGSGFILDATEWTANHKYLAVLTTTEPAKDLTAADFAGLWIKFIIDSAANIRITDSGAYFSGETVEAALQELGSILTGMEDLLKEI